MNYMGRIHRRTTQGKIPRNNLVRCNLRIDPAFDVKNDTINGTVDFRIYGETTKLHKTTAELRKEVRRI